jgi:hypothetical protein
VSPLEKRLVKRRYQALKKRLRELSTSLLNQRRAKRERHWWRPRRKSTETDWNTKERSGSAGSSCRSRRQASAERGGLEKKLDNIEKKEELYNQKLKDISGTHGGGPALKAQPA